ncbi:MAG: lamin tail domain-containing protein [Ferruginibacter sp.]
MDKKLLFNLIAVIFLNTITIAQITETFGDGDFTANPSWAGGTADWIINSSFQLQSNTTVANSTFYLSTANAKATTAEWDFYCQITFNPSSANYIDVYLTASVSDLTLNSTSGYFVRIGNTDDEISLYRKDATGAVIKIIDGANGILNTSNNIMKIRVVRDAANQWNLSRDLTGMGNNFLSEGVVTDATYTTSAFFGILVKQSTVASFAQRHFFDDIEIKNYVPDIMPPVLQSATPITNNTLDVQFNEPVDLISSQALINYVVSNGIGSPVTAVRDAANNSLVHLSFAGSFPNRTNLTLTVNGVNDLSANPINNGTIAFSYFTAAQYDVVIDEIMADPSPQVALPNNDWLELKNTSGFNINLQNWRLGGSGPMPAYTLKPDSFVIVCTASAVAAMSVYGPVISVTSFPSLNNSGDLVSLLSPQGTVIHAVNYTDDWYQNELKKGGGWTLEMIDTHNPCSGISNWKASVDAKGGTPAKKNSVDGANPDKTSPKLLRTYATDSVNIVLVFDESLDSVKAALATNYTISDGIGIPASAIPVGPLFDRVRLKLTATTALLRNKIYTVTVAGITDCVSNTISAANTARTGLYEHADSFNLVINEILFNPKPNGVDYVELYNRSNKIINLKNIYIANRATNGAVASITQLSTEDYLFFPQEFIVVTADAAAVKRDYIAQNLNAFITVSSTPSFNDDAGDVIILNEQGNIVDEVAYSDKWHFALISNTEGVALERIDYNAKSQDAANWHSASSSVGYGTPTYKNSQYRIDAEVKGDITVTPEIVSPDNDGLDDFATINYSFPEPGYVANITIFDAVGRPVRYLERNALSGIKGFYRWDGLGEKQQKLAVGIYIIYTEIFNLKGKTKKFKNVIVLARK